MEEKRYILLICLMFLLGTSCYNEKSAENAETIISIDLNETKKLIDLSLCFDSISLYRLNIPENEVIGVIKKIIFNDELILLLSDKQKQIFIFDVHGNYLRKIDRYGPGPEEYTSMGNFFLLDSFIVVVDVNASNLTFYDKNGLFHKKMAHQDIFRDIESYDNDSYLCFTPDYMPGNPYGIWLMDNNGLFARYVKNQRKYIPIA